MYSHYAIYVCSDIETYILILSDEPLLPGDRASLKHSEEMFSQMSCITGITTRLCDRSVLHEDAGKRVVDCLEKGGLQKAASRSYKLSVRNKMVQ